MNGFHMSAGQVSEDARHFYDKGLSLYNMQNLIAAEEAFLEALKLADNTDQKEIIAFSNYFLGDIEGWKSDFHKAILYHKEALRLFSELNNSEYQALSNNKISFDFESLGDYDSTLFYYKENIRKSDDVDAKYTVVDSYQNIVRVFADLNNYKEAYRYLQDGLEYAQGSETRSSLAKLYVTAGQVFLDNHVNKDIALEYLLEAKTLFTELDDPEYLFWTRLSIGDWYLRTDNDSLALVAYKEVRAELDSTNHSANSITDHRIGMAYKKIKDFESALEYFQKSIDEMCLVCPEILIHKTLLEAARLYLASGNKARAYEYLSRAKNIAAQSESGYEMVTSSEEMASYYQAINNTDSALAELTFAHNLAKELGLLERIKATAESLSQLSYSNGMFQASADYSKIANRMIDSLDAIERSNEVAKLEMRFEIEKREKENLLETQLLESEIAKQKLIRNTSLGGAILFIIIGIATLRAYRRKKRDNLLLSRQKAEIQDISEKLQESGKRKLDFFTNISHEIRTPLMLIKSPLESILKNDGDDNPIDSQVQIALNNTNKLKDLVNQILDLEKLDENLLRLDVSEFELLAFSKEIVSSFEGFCNQSNCRLTFNSNVTEAWIELDRLRMQSIISNLLSNAFKYNKPEGWVQFNLMVLENLVQIEIRDSGIGISQEHLVEIGKRYYQIEKTNAPVEGTGIGLAYVNELIDLMKGSIEISSIIGKGTIVTLSLPCKAAKIVSDQPLSMGIQPRESFFSHLEEQIADNDSKLPRILIIEDNFELRSLLKSVFVPSYQVITAKDGNEGREMADKYLPDLIISDIMMPGIKGNELCRVLKNNLNTSHITIILFTAKGGPDSIVDGYDCGADDYIVKPFETDLLVKKVNNIITTRENARKQFSFTDTERSSTSFSDFDKKFFEDCKSIIKENIGNSTFTVESLAEKMNVHRRTLLRKFSALTGKSPIDLIRHTRMTSAAELIKNKKYRVNEVALMVGYEDTNRFSQAFKQFHGVSPSAFK